MLRHEIIHEIVGNPRFLGESPCNDIIISQKCHVLVHETRRQEISAVIVQEGVMAAISPLKDFKFNF